MTRETIVGGSAGLIFGGLTGFFLGGALKRSLGPDAPELLGILGAGAGAVLIASIVNEVAPATTVASNAPTSSQTSSAQGTVPPFVPGA